MRGFYGRAADRRHVEKRELGIHARTGGKLFASRQRDAIAIPCNRPIIQAVAVLQVLRQSKSDADAGELPRILRLQVPVIVKLAERKLLLSEVMRLCAGAIIEFSKRSDEPLELMINNKTIGVGETVKIGENFGLRITQIGDVKQLIAALGGKS